MLTDIVRTVCLVS